jgi:2,3-diketo-5-methylthio-1-phosphopentane phosphatase
MKTKDCLIVADFDGTIATRDVGYSFFHHFSGGRNDELLPYWKSGELSTRECLLREAALVKTDKNQAYAFLESFEIDAGFPSFVKSCREQGISLTIMSDGLDFYIEFLLNKFGLTGLEAFSNRAIFENGGISIEFPFDNRQCNSCGSCKEERIEDLKVRHGQAHDIVFIGDGYSDACAAKAADILFAKKDLKKYCNSKGIKYLDYNDFDDVKAKLVDLGYMRERVPK